MIYVTYLITLKTALPSITSLITYFIKFPQWYIYGRNNMLHIQVLAIYQALLFL